MYELLKNLCLQKGITITKLCEEVTGSRGNLPTWKKENIKPTSLIKIADYFNVSIDYLLGRTDNPEITKNSISGNNVSIHNNIVDSKVGSISEKNQEIKNNNYKDVEDFLSNLSRSEQYHAIGDILELLEEKYSKNNF